jgi:hypothetical protein
MDEIEKEFEMLLNPEKERMIVTNTPRASDLPGARPIADILNERGKTHGDYTLHAEITQKLKEVMVGFYRPEHTRAMRESMEMQAHKLGRILAGDPDFRDHWDDIAGYAKLVADRCTK